MLRRLPSVIFFTEETVNHHIFEFSLVEIMLFQPTFLFESHLLQQSKDTLVVGEDIIGDFVEIQGVEAIINEHDGGFVSQS